MKKADIGRKISSEERGEILKILKARFNQFMKRHPGMNWTTIESRLAAHPDKLWSLNEMEKTGGEPDVIGLDNEKNEFIFVDCSEESPKGRRSLCFDQDGWLSRKEARPENNAVEMAAELGIDILTEAEYRDLQKLGHFEAKTSSWVQTPAQIRQLGGALFGDFRYDTVFIYHNGAQSYYAARGFLGSLRV